MTAPAPSRAILILALSAALFAPSAFAQFSRASILGQVVDSTNSGIPRAVVKITRIETNESVETITDASGGYSFAFLNPGAYRLQVSASGFKALDRVGLHLDTDDTISLPVALSVGDVSERVTVAADRERLDMSSASHGTRLDPVKLRDLPLVGRQAYSLVSLTPGVIFTQEQFGTTGFAGFSANWLKQVSRSFSSFEKRQSVTTLAGTGSGLVCGGRIAS